MGDMAEGMVVAGLRTAAATMRIVGRWAHMAQLLCRRRRHHHHHRHPRHRPTQARLAATATGVATVAAMAELASDEWNGPPKSDNAVVASKPQHTHSTYCAHGYCHHRCWQVVDQGDKFSQWMQGGVSVTHAMEENWALRRFTRHPLQMRQLLPPQWMALHRRSEQTGGGCRPLPCQCPPGAPLAACGDRAPAPPCESCYRLSCA